jgi:hypothetical protein
VGVVWEGVESDGLALDLVLVASEVLFIEMLMSLFSSLLFALELVLPVLSFSIR